jgi:hypothetical protein
LFGEALSLPALVHAAHGAETTTSLRRSNRLDPKERRQLMDFFKILNFAGTILAWIVVLAVVWAVTPVIAKLFVGVQSIHDFPK